MSITLFAYDPTLTVAGLGGTFTRADASTCATYVDSNGVVQTVAANVLRNSHYVSGVRTTLLEGSRVNGITNSQDLSNGSALNNCTVGADAIAAPDGTTTADKLQEDNTNNEHSVSRTTVPATTVSTLQTVSAFVKAGERTWCHFSTVNRDAAVWRSWVNLSTGAAGTTNANHTVRITALGSSWYRVAVTFDSGAAAGALQFAIGAATADNTVSYLGTTGSGIYVWGRMWEADKPFPSSYIATGAAAVTRAADALSFPFLPVPQAMTVYADLYNLTAWGSPQLGIFDLGTYNGAAGTTLSAYSSATVAPRGNLFATSEKESQPSVSPAYADRLEARLQVDSTGILTAGGTLNSGSETLGTATAANALTASFRVSTLTIGAGAGLSAGFWAVRKLVIASGVQSLATMRTLTATSGVVSATLAPSSVVAEGAWYAQPAYTVLDTGTATALQASAIPTNTNQQVRVLRLDVTCSAAPAAGTIVNIQDGGTVLWQGVLSAGSRKLTVDFTRKPLRGSRGATVTAEMASAGGSVVQTIVMTCDTVRAP